MSRSRVLTPTEAVQAQREMAERVRREVDCEAPSTVAGIDVSLRAERAFAAVCVLSFPALEPIESRTSERPVEFPYVPGLLAFREVPVILQAFETLDTRPDLLLVDGHGLAHPRRCGLACHVGIELDLPTIGCAKSRLVGEHAEPGERRGNRRRLTHRGEVVGTVLRTRDGVRPIYVSIGHRIDLDTAVRLVLACGRGYRLPEPTRMADHVAGVASRATAAGPRTRSRRRKA